MKVRVSASQTVVTVNALGDAQRWFPDASMSVAETVNGFTTYLPLSTSWLGFGYTPYPEDIRVAWPIHYRDPKEQWDNGGRWFNSVYKRDDKYMGFYHAEDHWRREDNPDHIAWKSIAVAQSYDGLVWHPGTQIITAHESRPGSPRWGGAGDHTVIWDGRNKWWVAYFSERAGDNYRICAAMSDDPAGMAGWFKWYRGAFLSPGIGGVADPLPGLDSVPGANPSVTWNYHVQRWVMAWHGWDGNIYLALSVDGCHWDDPQLVAFPSKGYDRTWYPTLIGARGTELTGMVLRLYYAEMNDKGRRLAYRGLRFP